MGQAKQRNAEILALKSKGPKLKLNIAGFGAYYKDNLDDGVSIFLRQDDPNFPPNFVPTLYRNMSNAVTAELADIKNGITDTKEIWTQLKSAIYNFNIKCFGYGVTRPTKSNYQIDVKECMPEIIAIMSDIWILTELGEITNDNFNGMHYMYN